MSFVGNELDRERIAYPPNLILDTVDIYRRLYPGMPSYSLLSLARQFGLSQTQEHRGLSDAHLVRRLLCGALNELPIVDDTPALKRLFSVYQMSDWKPEPSGLPVQFADLASAVENRAPVEIVYQSAGTAESIRVIRPIQVQRLGSIHYIVAFCEKSQAERTFRLDRIVSYRII
jgi:predicted DNA-binding transcriptional regulator YafY